MVTENDGISVVWHCKGTGAPLVLLHGGYGSWKHWLRNVEALAERYRVLIPDMPGFGDSSDPEDLHNLTSIAYPIVAGLNELIGPDGLFAVGAFSFGGSVAAAVIQLCPARIPALMLVGSGGLRLRRPPAVELHPWRHLRREEAVRAAHRRNLALIMFSDPSLIDEAAVDIQAHNAVAARVKSRPLSRLGLLHDVLRDFDGKLCGIWGEDDFTARGFISERSDLLRAFQPDAAFYTIPGAGHWVQYERSAEVDSAVLEFLASVRY